MIDTRWEWTNSTGGPLILAETGIARHWRGTLGNSDSLSDGKMTDYDRACQKTEYLQTICCAEGKALVLGDEPLQSAVTVGKFGEPLVVRWIYSSGLITTEMFSTLTSFPEIAPRNLFRVLTGEMLLFDSSENLEMSWRTHSVYKFPSGSYDVTTEEMLVENQRHFLIHRFIRN